MTEPPPESESLNANKVPFGCPWYGKMTHLSTQERQAAGSMVGGESLSRAREALAGQVCRQWVTAWSQGHIVKWSCSSLVPYQSVPVYMQIGDNRMYLCTENLGFHDLYGLFDVAVAETTEEEDGDKLKGCPWGSALSAGHPPATAAPSLPTPVGLCGFRSC